MSNILKNIKKLIESAQDIVTSDNNIYEWSVGNLGSQIDQNITDKVSLKSIKKDDILVIAKTSIYSLASQQDSDGDIQLSVVNITGTDVNCEARNGESIDLDLLEMRILEAYSMTDSDVKIFVVDLPTKINKSKFESLDLESIKKKS